MPEGDSHSIIKARVAWRSVGTIAQRRLLEKRMGARQMIGFSGGLLGARQWE